MKNVLVWMIFLGFQMSFAQNSNVIKHKVEKGQTITQIAKKYNVTPLDIYRLNPDAQAGVSENTLLLIPNKSNVEVKKKVAPSSVAIKKHEVLPKETLYSLSKLYNVTIEDIEKANVSELKEGMKIGLVLNIPVAKGYVKPQEAKPNNISAFHEVKAQETKYGIAKQYDITIEQLEKLNPEIANKELPLGYKLQIKGERAKAVLPVVEVPKKASTNDYVVKEKETLYSLSNQFDVTQEELIALNPELKNGIQEGATIKVPVKIVKPVIKNQYVDLSKTVKQNGRKKLALLLPFNLVKQDQDTVNSTKTRLKKDKFLNMTLDFYAGALVAIDSVNKMKLKVDVTILDSNETSTKSNVANLIQENNLKTFDAIIGPFYQNNTEKTAELVGNIPVISPLSKDYDKKYSNLIQATPTSDDVKNAMFDFMREKGGNILAVIDPKKGSIKQFISENHKDAQFVNFNENQGLDVAHLKSLLVKDKINFVIMETEKTNLILNTTSALVSSLAEYQIRLVILSENEALDYEEIPMTRLTKLKMHYPSTQKVNNTPEANAFEVLFKRKNKVLPNQFATRGFDVTFDVLMRLNQEKSILETCNDSATEQIESKFNYVQIPEGGYVNKGVYILYYDTDLTVKEAK